MVPVMKEQAGVMKYGSPANMPEKRKLSRDQRNRGKNKDGGANR